MNCTKFEKYIILESEGLSSIEQSELEQHLLICSSCRKIHEQFGKSSVLVNKLNKKEPVLQNPGTLTIQIIQSVKNLEAKNRFSIADIFNQILDWFFTPFVRPVLVSVAVFMISWFIYSESSDQIEIANLENRLSEYSVNEFVAVHNSHSHFLNLNTLKKYREFRTYFIKNDNHELASFNFLNKSKQLNVSKPKINLLKQSDTIR